MKWVIVIFCFEFCSLISSAQSLSVDSLIKHIDNSQIEIAIQYGTYYYMKSSWGDSLIKIGKSASPKLIKALDDTTKGVIANFILFKIWRNELPEVSIEFKYDSLFTDAYPIDTVRTASSYYLWPGLVTYRDNKNHLTASQKSLKKWENFWLSFTAKQNIR